MATLTLRNVPDELYQRLKREAARNRRSLNQEAISLLEKSSPRSSDDVEAELARLDAFRASLGERNWPTAEEIDAMIENGRD